MRDQYVGDISDMLKYSLLRHLAGGDRSLGLAWYYNPDHDGRNDGSHIEYLDDPHWGELDPPLWLALKSLPARSLSVVQALPIWPPSSTFHDVQVPSAIHRKAWANGMVEKLSPSDLVFLDPDNGLGRVSRRHATVEEIKSLRRSGRAIVLIKFPGRIQFDQQQSDHHAGIRTATGAEDIVTLRTSVIVPSLNGGKVPRFRWFTMLDHNQELLNRMSEFMVRLNAVPGVRASMSR